MCSQAGLSTQGGTSHSGNSSSFPLTTTPGGVGMPAPASFAFVAALSSANARADDPDPTILAPWASRSRRVNGR